MPKIIEDEAIFRAVIQIITDRGYSGATTKQMAESAGVSEVTLFRKYESKQQLVRLAIAALIDQTDFESAVQYTGDIESDLLRILHAYEGSVVSYWRFFAVLFTEISRSSELADSFDLPITLFNSIGQLLMQYQIQGVLRREIPFHSVAALLGPIIYMAMVGSAIQSKESPPLDLQQHVGLFLSGRLNQ